MSRLVCLGSVMAPFIDPLDPFILNMTLKSRHLIVNLPYVLFKPFDSCLILLMFIFRYRVYLENDDYDDMSSSMESSAIVDYSTQEKKVSYFETSPFPFDSIIWTRLFRGWRQVVSLFFFNQIRN